MEQNLLKINNLYASGMYGECISKIDLALAEGQTDPVSAKLLNLKGLCLSHQNEHNRAVECYVAAIKLDPLYPVPYSNIADSHAKNLQFGEAKKYFELALTIDENLAEAVAGLGVVAFQSQDYETAVQQFTHALKLRPNDEMMLTNLGNTLAVQGEYDKALKLLNRVITMNPGNSMARTNRGLILLGRKEWARGWRDYEYRFDSGNFLGKKYQELPTWTGNPASPRSRVVIWAEQGLGDEIMFSTIFKDLEQREETFLIECDTRLLEVFQKSFPKLNFFKKNSNLRSEGLTHQIPIASLGLLFREGSEKFFTNHGHLLTTRNLDFGEQIDALKKLGKKVLGVSWGSYALTSNFRMRKSIPSGDFQNLLQKLDNYTLINLQFSNPHKHESGQPEEPAPQMLKTLAGLDTLRDVTGLLSVLKELDGVLSIGNTLAHMAGAVGTPAVILLPSVADWRWGDRGTDTPWYSSLHLLRNNQGSWADFLDHNTNQISLGLMRLHRE